jgi:hypothetical protein
MATTTLGKGSFGLVFAPALDNVDPNGNPVSFPKNVTKLFYRGSNYEKALRNYNVLRESVPSVANGVRLTKYTRKYKFRNLPNSIKANIKSRRPYTDEWQPMYPVRTPYLGVSFSDLHKHTVVYSHVPIETTIREVYKIMKQIKEIGDAGYVHADIRETNVMVNPNTGIMTLIDFDWLTRKDEILDEYPQSFYSHPIETMFFIGMINEDFLDDHQLGGYEILKGFNVFLRDYLRSNEIPEERALRHINGGLDVMINEIGMPGIYPPTYMADAMEFMAWFYKTYKGADSEILRNGLIKTTSRRIVNTIDSFGWGICLIKLMQNIANTPETAAFKEFCESSLIPNLMHGNVLYRMPIEVALAEYSAFVKRAYPGASLSASVPSSNRSNSLAASFKRLPSSSPPSPVEFMALPKLNSVLPPPPPTPRRRTNTKLRAEASKPLPSSNRTRKSSNSTSNKSNRA